MNMNKLSIHEIISYLPHRYPFMLIDRVTDFEKGVSIQAVKNVTYNEPFFTGHFPENPVMPGVLVVEALAQAAGILIFLTNGKPIDHKNIYYFAGIENARFKRVVGPGDQLQLFVKVNRHKLDVWKFSAEAKVDGNVVCVAELTIAK